MNNPDPAAPPAPLSAAEIAGSLLPPSQTSVDCEPLSDVELVEAEADHYEECNSNDCRCANDGNPWPCDFMRAASTIRVLAAQLGQVDTEREKWKEWSQKADAAYDDLHNRFKALYEKWEQAQSNADNLRLERDELAARLAELQKERDTFAEVVGHLRTCPAPHFNVYSCACGFMLRALLAQPPAQQAEGPGGAGEGG